MKIYYQTDKYNQDYIIKRCAQRLEDEGNSEVSIRDWMSQGVTTADLSEFDYSSRCDEVKRLFAANEVAYVIAELDDSDFVYIGVSDRTLIDADGNEVPSNI